MNREIRFRAWDGQRFTFFPVGVNYQWPTDHIIQQFTGLTDKLGKEIYEGDILEAISEDEENCDCEHCFPLIRKGDKVIVVWLDGGFRLYPAKDYLEYFGKDGVCEWCGLKSENMMSENHEIPIGYFTEVIGNVWENPDLLK